MKNFKRSAAVLGVVATASVALAACSEGGEGGELIGEGASSQQNAMDYFGTKFSETGSSLAYNASGSGSGRQNFIGGQADFAGSDSPLKEEQVDPAKDRCGGADAWHLPFVIGPVAIGYNLDGVDNLTFETEGNDMVVDSDALFAMDTEGAYPLVLTTYEIVCSDYSDTDKPETAETLKSFLNLALDHQDDELADRGYIPVTGEHADRLKTAVEAIK